MAHNINYNPQSGKHSFFSVKEKAWHSLGQMIGHYPTSAEAIEEAGLDYWVDKRPLFTHQTQGISIEADPQPLIHDIEIPDFFATVRADMEIPLGIVGSDYHVVQNKDAFTFFDAIVGGDNGILYETAGALGNGERIFITAKLPDYIRVGRDDLIEQYLFLTTSHDGTGSITIAFTPIRIVCNNTLNAALRSHSNCIKIRHTASAQDKLKEAYKMLGLTNVLSEQLETIYNRWARVRIADSEVKRLIQIAMAPSREVLTSLQEGRRDELSSHYTNIVESVFEYAMASPSQQEVTAKGTLFGAYNAVTGYFQNVRNFKDEEAKFKSIMYGTGLNRTQSAFDLCMGFAKSGADALILS